jgi:hypothetical protein
MKKWKIMSILALALTVAGATIASTYALCWWGPGANAPYGQYSGPTNPYVQTPITITTPTPATTTPQTEQNLAPVAQTNTQTPTLYTPTTQINLPGYSTYGGWGGACRGRWGYGTPTYTDTATTATQVTITQAIQIATTYTESLNNPDLKVAQVEEYTANFYVLVTEKSTGNGAFELLINKYTGVVTPEMGPSMMWNTKYAFNTGYCNWNRGTTTPTINDDTAKTYAQQYLNTYLTGTTVGDATTLPGYCTIEILSGNSPYGTLSVNAYTGQIWFHNWHGTFIQKTSLP